MFVAIATSILLVHTAMGKKPSSYHCVLCDAAARSAHAAIKEFRDAKVEATVTCEHLHQPTSGTNASTYIESLSVIQLGPGVDVELLLGPAWGPKWDKIGWKNRKMFALISGCFLSQKCPQKAAGMLMLGSLLGAKMEPSGGYGRGLAGQGGRQKVLGGIREGFGAPGLDSGAPFWDPVGTKNRTKN